MIHVFFIIMLLMHVSIYIQNENIFLKIFDENVFKKKIPMNVRNLVAKKI